MTAFDINRYLQTHWQLIEEELERLFPPRRGPHQELFEAARYILLGGGKRLRPILTLAVVQMLGGDLQTALTPACALELIHTYSLMHDDLPCMDDDDYRRGKLTVHRKYSEGLAVLTGDFLLTYAFEIIATSPNLHPEKKVQLVAILAKRSGSEGMIGGQVMDLAYGGKKVPLETVKLLHRNKTAALLTAAIEFGGVLCNAMPQQMESLRLFGENIGLAFQVIDDILDITSSEAKHGKSVSSDILNEKCTFASLLGVDQAQSYALNYYHQAMQSLKPLQCDTSLLASLADFVLKRKN